MTGYDERPRAQLGLTDIFEVRKMLLSIRMCSYVCPFSPCIYKAKRIVLHTTRSIYISALLQTVVRKSNLTSSIKLSIHIGMAFNKDTLKKQEI